jgi:hypothetical protein
MKRAFIFTLDAMFAVSLMVLFLVVVSSEMAQPRDADWLPKLGNQLMTSIDKLGSFHHTYHQSDVQVQSMLNSYLDSLPPNINGKITIKLYSTAGDEFNLMRTIESAKGEINPAHETHFKRLFIHSSDNHFGTAELVLSYG